MGRDVARIGQINIRQIITTVLPQKTYAQRILSIDKKPTKQKTVWLVLLFRRFERLTVMMKKLYAAFAFGSRPKIACKTVKPAITPKIT